MRYRAKVEIECERLDDLFDIPADKLAEGLVNVIAEPSHADTWTINGELFPSKIPFQVVLKRLRFDPENLRCGSCGFEAPTKWWKVDWFKLGREGIERLLCPRCGILLKERKVMDAV